MSRIIAIAFIFLALSLPPCSHAEGFGKADFMGGYNALLRSAAQESGASHFIAVGRVAWPAKQYQGLIASFRVSDGTQDLNFALDSGFLGRRLFDFAGVGGDNLCNNVISLGSSNFIAACRGQRATGYHDIYLVKFNSTGTLDTAFGTSGIVTTGLGGTTNYAFVRGIAAQGSDVTIAGATGLYSGAGFHPFIASYDTSTGALTQGPTTIIAALTGTAVGLTWDTTTSAYYMASTETSGNHSFYVHKFNTSLSASGSPWGDALSFSNAGGGADSIPAAIAINAGNAIVVGGSRTNISSTPWRCAVAAVNTASGSLETSFGYNTVSGSTSSHQLKGVTLYSQETDAAFSRDCILNSVAVIGGNTYVAGTAYNGSNYDYHSAKLNATGALQNSSTVYEGSADDVTNGILFFDGSASNYYLVGRSHNAKLYSGQAITKVVASSSDSWTPTLSTTSNPAGRESPTGVWTGSKMIVWAGQQGNPVSLNTGGQYDPVNDSWTSTLSTTNNPTIRNTHTAIWTGSKMIVWGGQNSSVSLNTGGQYDPTNDSWTPTLSTTNTPGIRFRQAAVWTGFQNDCVGRVE